MRKSIRLFLVIIIPVFANAQAKISYAKSIGNTIINTLGDYLSPPGKPAKWTYGQDVVLQGMQGLWKATGDGKYFKYIQKGMDFFVDESGKIRTYAFGEFQLDNIAPGRDLLFLYNVTGQKKYLEAVQTLRKQLASQPRINEGGFWHKKIYPNQMWLDGLYMAEPFYTGFANTFHEDTAYNDIAKQFILMEKNTRDSKTGLLYHGYDESKQQKWANSLTGRSPIFGRGAWAGMEWRW